MGKRKIYRTSSLATPGIEYTRNFDGRVVIPLDVIPPADRHVQFQGDGRHGWRFDFNRWYDVGIDQITYASQRQIERFLDKQDRELEAITVIGYCRSGLGYLLDYLALQSLAMQRELTLHDIDRNAIDGYLGFLRDLGVATPSQRKYYDRSKAVLQALGRRGLIRVRTGEDATFPRNPFPRSNSKSQGETPLATTQRKAFTAAVKTAVLPLLAENAKPTSELLAYALLVVALHTGRNTTPLLEMPRDCLRAHPKNDTLFLMLYKRRGYSTSKVALQKEPKIHQMAESMPAIRPTVVRLIRRVIELTEHLRGEAPGALKDRVWLYRSQGGASAGQVSTLVDHTLGLAIKKLVADHRLLDSDGKPLRINVSRLRKTFVNRIYEILDGDIATTAIAAGNSSQVTNVNYLRPGEEAKKNWQFMGTVLVQELQTSTIGATERTPVGQCSDTREGEFAPRRDGAICMSFLNCMRCRNYVVTGDDLHRLFSFYWRVLSERSRAGRWRWEKQLAHIPRLIERDVIEPGLAKGIFKQDQVTAARERARQNPHAFWKSDTVIGDLETLS